MNDTVALPEHIRLFPIRGCILSPGEALPLNVFEPRYLNMVDDAMASDRCLAVIQPRPGGPPERPVLERIGTAGRIASFRETGDGRYLIVLAALSRFHLGGEIDTQTPYRVARADYAGFEADLDPDPASDDEAERTRFLALLRRFFAHAGIEADWTGLDRAPLAVIVNKVCMAAPFDAPARQALLEAPDAAARGAMLAGMMRATVDDGEGRGA